MNKVKCLLLVNILGMLFISVPLAASDSPDVKEVLRKFTEARKNFNSFIVECESGKTFNYPQHNWSGKIYNKVEYRFDGNRSRARNALWGKVDIRSPNVSEDQAHYTSTLWDGENTYFYNRATPSDSGHVVLSREKDPGGTPEAYKNVIKGSGIIGEMMGYHWGDNGKRINEVLLGRAEQIEQRQEKLRGVDCYVIDAVVKGHGKYTLWIDPTHDYHIAKIQVQRKENDYIHGRLLKKKDYSDEMFEVLRFERIGDSWFPMQYGMKRTICDNGDVGTEDESINITNIVLNPDHDALKSFIPDDIPNGATANIVAFPSSLEFIWQDGKVVTSVDRKLLEQLDAEIEKIMSDPNTMILASKTQTLSATLTVSELLKKYAETQEKLKSFIAKAETTIEYSKVSGLSGQMEKERCEFRFFDGDRVNHRSSVLDKLLSKEKTLYKSFLWDGKSFIQYRQGSQLTDSTVFIEKNDSKKKRMIATEYKGAPLMGICGGDYERVDLILSKADIISLADKTENIHGADCYIIDAQTKRGKYRVWIDPQHDYNIAKIELQKRKGDLIRSGEHVKIGMLFLLENVRFEKIDGVWVPMEADMQQTEDNQNKMTKLHHKRTRMTLNPDHNALRSFLPDDIPEGTKITISDDFSHEYIWHNGKPVAEVEKDVKF